MLDKFKKYLASLRQNKLDVTIEMLSYVHEELREISLKLDKINETLENIYGALLIKDK